VEQIEKSSTAQLAREIEVALPVELSRAEQLALVRAYVKDNFVSVGMCADFAIHDKGTGNPHAHILLTIRPIKENGEWGAKWNRSTL
jgi:ATP-dependent exoDNAse (exonuclease V) alpha subunit